MKFFNKKSTADLGPGIGKPRSFWKRIGRDPKVDWALSIATSFVVAIVFAVLGISKYLSYYSDVKEQVTSSKTANSVSIDTKDLDMIINKYIERDSLRQEVIRSYIGPSDPSI